MDIDRTVVVQICTVCFGITPFVFTTYCPLLARLAEVLTCAHSIMDVHPAIAVCVTRHVNSYVEVSGIIEPRTAIICNNNRSIEMFIMPVGLSEPVPGTVFVFDITDFIKIAFTYFRLPVPKYPSDMCDVPACTIASRFKRIRVI